MDGDEQNAYDKIVRRRVTVLAVLFAVWLVPTLGRAWYIAIPGRDKYIAVGENMARRTVTIPAVRGRILDADGIVLAWSEHFYDLESAAPGSALDGEELAALKKVIPDLKPNGKLLRRNLTPGEVMGLEELIRSGVRVKIVARNERIVIDSPEIRRRVGVVRREPGIMRGASGWEKEFDRELAGSPGRISVMLDRERNWIRSSVKVLEPMVKGRDVRLKQPLRELERPSAEAENAE